MANSLDSFDNMLAACAVNGSLPRFFNDTLTATTTAATTSSGYISGQRYARTFTMPSVGGNVTAGYMTYIRFLSEDTTSLHLAALETTLGSLTVNGNSFSSGSSMPTKSLRISAADYSITTASIVPVVVITSTLTATTPVLTITYTDQDGNTGATATLTLPTNAAANSVFLVAPHLASGDTGIRAVTNISISAGTAGSITVYGLLPLGHSMLETVFEPNDPLTSPVPMYPIAANDIISFYRFGLTTTSQLLACFTIIPNSTT